MGWKQGLSEPAVDALERVNVVMPGCWRPEHVALISPSPEQMMPMITAADVVPITSDRIYWDIWPVQLDDGALAHIASGSLWCVLAAPRTDNPDDRHDQARIHLLLNRAGAWVDCGPLLPEGWSPGSREWSGSARLDPRTMGFTLWFTATGRRGDGVASFEQRLFHSCGVLDPDGPLPRVSGWSDPMASVENDGQHYVQLDRVQGVPGRIKGFRDPYWFRDPADGQGYLLFTGSKAAAASRSDHDGVVGLARAEDGDGLLPFTLLPPLIDSDGLCNELERPHVFRHGGLYYLFWSSQRSVFMPDGPTGPTALYGMAAPALTGPWQPLNGSGLVMANPDEEPRQAYAWQVLPSLEVVSFIDHWGLRGGDIFSDAALKARQFGGTIAPMMTLALDGYTTRVVGRSR